MKRFTAIVVAITIALLTWVPARGERSSSLRQAPIRLPDPKPYIYKPCTRGPIDYLGCIKPHQNHYLYIDPSGEHVDTYQHTCRNVTGKGNGNKYPCVYYRDGEYLVYAVDIY